ncbi:MAG TPA: alpha/beta fold hydrolase [Solirubrobacteraceae bacterium]|nr:alpha/beta fold hydrolase [Solirubrobacteraceae bacterium]
MRTAAIQQESSQAEGDTPGRGWCQVITVLVAAIASLLVAGSAYGQALAPCREVPKELNARCGSVTVPLDRADPGLGTTRVAFALVPRRDAARPSLGTLVGPGNAGSALIDRPADVLPSFGLLLDRRDLVLIDPRGTGRSDPIACRALGKVALGFTAPTRMSDAIGACGRELGPRVGAYGNAAIADDMDAVRAALGVERLDLFGSSYGTYLMTVYAARHPDHVRSIVLDAGYPIDYDPWGLDRLEAARRSIRLVCARTHACKSARVLTDVARLAARLRRAPVSFSARAGSRRLRLRIDETALATALWSADPAALGGLPAVVRSALAGDLVPLRRRVETLQLQLAGALADPAAGGSATEAAFLAGACHDFPRPFSYADPVEVRRAAYDRAVAAIPAAATAPFSARAWVHAGFEAPDWCLSWPEDPTAGLPLPPGTPLPSVPVLVLSGDLDANVPASQGRAIAAQYPRATFVEIPNVGHTPNTRSACAAAVAAHFVRALSADVRACVGTGAPPPVPRRTPVRAADLALVAGAGTRAQRRALAVVATTIADARGQARVFQQWGSATGPRGGRYVARSDGGARLVGVRVVRDATVSGVLSPTPAGIAGTVRLAGSGVPAGRLRVQLATSGRGHATGTLNGQTVELAFRAI